MPDGDREHDAFDLPFHAQSGNVDLGHLSENVQSEESRLRGIQGEGLNNALNDYYSGDATYSEFYSSLTELGYSEDRIGDISDGAYIEREFRQTHTDGQGNPAPSGLSLNQLGYLREQLRQGYDITNTTIHTDDDGRVFVDDYRTREDDGTPARLYLPPAEQFNPLTRTQQSQIRIDERYLSHITLEEPSGTGEILKDNVDLQTRHQISQLIATYLSQTSNPGNDQRREQLYRDIQNLDGLHNQRNIRPKLIQLFNDIAMEQQYRVMNDGRPQGLTDTQWEQLQNNPNYYGQVILKTDTNPPISYIISGQNYIEIDDDIEPGRRPRDFSVMNNQDINLFATEFLTDGNEHDNPQILTDNILSAIRYDPDDPNDLRILLQTEDIVNSLNQERIFRSQNDGRPSDISALQYEFMLNHALQQGEPRYSGEPLSRTTLADGSIGYGFHSWDTSIPELIIIPTDAIIEEMIDNGVYTRPQPEEPPRPDTSPDDNLQPPRRPPIPAGGLPPLPTPPSGVLPPEETPPIPTADPRFTLPPDTEIRPSISGAGEPHLRPLPARGEAPPSFDPPIVPGQTQPINLRTGEDLPIDNLERNVIRYQRFFNDNQSLYYGFREAFRDILPVLSAGAGGYMTYLYEASKHKGTIQTIINQETELLSQLQGRIEATSKQLGKEKLKLVLRITQGTQLERDIQTFSQGIGGAQNIPPEVRLMVVDEKINDLAQVSELISDQINTIEKLQNQIRDSDVYTTQIDNNIQELQNRNYEILNDLRSSAPKILMGVNVGYTLGLMLSGYLFPTYMNINEPYMTAENIEYTQTNTNQDKITKLEKSTIEKKDVEIPPTIKREYDAPPSKIVKPFEEKFRPIKHGKRPLKYKEIQELKATLSPSELNNLKNKFLFFDDGKLSMEKTDDKCKNIIGETIISKRKVFI